MLREQGKRDLPSAKTASARICSCVCYPDYWSPITPTTFTPPTSLIPKNLQSQGGHRVLKRKMDLREETRAPGLSIPSPVAHPHFNTQLHFHSYPSRYRPGWQYTRPSITAYLGHISHHSQITAVQLVITLGPSFSFF